MQQLDQQEEAALPLGQDGRWLMQQLWTVAKPELLADYPGSKNIVPGLVGLELQSASKDKKSVALVKQVRSPMTCKYSLKKTSSSTCLIHDMLSLSTAAGDSGQQNQDHSYQMVPL